MNSARLSSAMLAATRRQITKNGQQGIVFWNTSQQYATRTASTSCQSTLLNGKYNATLLSNHAYRYFSNAPNQLPPGYQLKSRSAIEKAKQRAAAAAGKDKEPSGANLMIKAGLPFVLFSLLAAWVVSNALSGKLKEMETAQGKTSKSIRQAAMEQEHEEMLERLNKIVQQDFDNTKRIKRPEEILEERRAERERRNKWYRRLYRWVFRIKKEEEVFSDKKN